MKTDKHNLDLETLLATLEHAGRDERRQQELGEMIDRLAGVESGERRAESGEWRVESGERRMESGEWRVESGKRRTAWWWVSRVAAAACVLFFIVTAVRIWFIPTEGGAPMVAEAEVPEVVLPAATATTAEPEPAVTVARRGQVKPMAVQPVVVVEQEESPVVAEYLVEETPDTVEAPIIIEEVVTPEPVMVAQVEPQVEPLPDPEKAAEPVAKPQEHRRSLFGSLIRRAEPSKMDGTMLAFNLL